MKTSAFPRMHVSLYVSDLLQTISFYNSFFGKAPEKIRRGYVKYVLDGFYNHHKKTKNEQD